MPTVVVEVLALVQVCSGTFCSQFCQLVDLIYFSMPSLLVCGHFLIHSSLVLSSKLPLTLLLDMAGSSWRSPLLVREYLQAFLVRAPQHSTAHPVAGSAGAASASANGPSAGGPATANGPASANGPSAGGPATAAKGGADVGSRLTMDNDLVPAPEQQEQQHTEEDQKHGSRNCGPQAGLNDLKAQQQAKGTQVRVTRLMCSSVLRLCVHPSFAQLRYATKACFQSGAPICPR